MLPLSSSAGPVSPAAPEALPGLDEKLRFMRSFVARADASSVDIIETHMSWVFLSACRVFKLKKPVRFPFLDFSTTAAREFHCREEVRLNARLAPGVYLGVLALQWQRGGFALVPAERPTAPGKIVDWVVLMRRLPEDRMLSSLMARGHVGAAEIDALIALLGHFYRHAMGSPLSHEEYASRFHREQASNREVLLRPQFALDQAALALDRMDRALVRHMDLLQERCSHILEGHGDLRPEHVCLIDPPVVIDCLEFNAQLRQVDPFDELAFLALECSLAGADWIGPRLLAGLSIALNDRPSHALICLYTAHRALLRARLAMAHLLDPAPRTPEKWPALAQRCLQRAIQALGELAGDVQPFTQAPLLPMGRS